MRTLTARLATSCLLLCLSSAPAALRAAPKQMPWEATPPPRLIEDRLRLDVGLWNVSINTSLRADATPTQLGTTLSGESDIGLTDKRVMPDIELVLLPGKRQLFRLNGFSSRRSGTAVLTQNVRFDGNDYFINDTVKSTLNLDLVGVGYAWRLFKAPRYELDVGLDVNIAAVETNVFVPRRAVREADDAVVPIPMLDVEARWEVIKNWHLLGRYRSCCLGLVKDNDISGSITDWRVGVQWQFAQHLGVGLHYRSFNVQVESASGSQPGAVRLDHKGAELAFRASL